MPFGFSLPGPFTWHAQDKASKKLSRQQDLKDAEEFLEQMKEDSLHKNLIKYLGDEKGVEAIYELNRLKGVSHHLHRQFEKELRRQIRTAKSEEKAARKG